jgi:riboflavin biosynthesis pyrimidine reductase
MRALLPAPADDVDVHEFYAADWLDRGGLRAVFVASADGAAWARGRSSALQTPGDNRVFHAMRDLADVVLAGCGTVLAERYQAIVVPPERAEIRRRYGLREVLPTAVLSRSLNLDPRSGLFAAPPEARTIVLTCTAAPAERRATLAEVADVAVCGDAVVDPVLARAALEERGLTRIAFEGGPHAFAGQAAAGVVDELCLSVTPKLVGPGPSRIMAGAAEWPELPGLRLTGLLEEDGALFARYLIDRA